MTYFLLLVFDQFLKFLALRRNLAVINFGLVLGLFSTADFFTGILVTAVLLLSLLFWKERKPELAQPLNLILTGGFSNLLDRILYHGVVDYLHLPFSPSFNLADLSVCLGFLLLARKLILKTH